jgi:hypothetical protein
MEQIVRLLLTEASPTDPRDLSAGRAAHGDLLIAEAMRELWVGFPRGPGSLAPYPGAFFLQRFPKVPVKPTPGPGLASSVILPNKRAQCTSVGTS